MKKFVVILFLLITGLSISVPAWEQCEESIFQICQSDSDCDEGCCSSCSPFYLCGSCHGFEPALQTMNFLVPTIQKNILTPYIQFHFTAFCGDIWQPPKFA